MFGVNRYLGHLLHLKPAFPEILPPPTSLTLPLFHSFILSPHTSVIPSLQLGLPEILVTSPESFLVELSSLHPVLSIAMMKAILPARTLLFVGLAIGVARAKSVYQLHAARTNPSLMVADCCSALTPSVGRRQPSP